MSTTVTASATTASALTLHPRRRPPPHRQPTRTAASTSRSKPSPELDRRRQPTVLEIQVPGSPARHRSQALKPPSAPPSPTLPHRAPSASSSKAKAAIVDRTHALMAAAVLLIALTVAVSVLATLSASVLERRRDFALMKALAAPKPASSDSSSSKPSSSRSSPSSSAGSSAPPSRPSSPSSTSTPSPRPPSSFSSPSPSSTPPSPSSPRSPPLQTLRRLQPAALLRGD